MNLSELCLLLHILLKIQLFLAFSFLGPLLPYRNVRGRSLGFGRIPGGSPVLPLHAVGIDIDGDMLSHLIHSAGDCLGDQLIQMLKISALQSIRQCALELFTGGAPVLVITHI